VRDVVVFSCCWRLVEGDRAGSRFSKDEGSWRRWFGQETEMAGGEEEEGAL
jgi:hypothetical protein